MKRAAVYVRVSTAGQEDEETIKNQLLELQERIKIDGCLLAPECVYEDDGWTGTLLERPGLDRLRSDAKEGLFEVLYFYDRGRIARKFVYQELCWMNYRAWALNASAFTISTVLLQKKCSWAVSWVYSMNTNASR